MPTRQSALDPVFKALADPTRRAVLAQLSGGPAAVKELAAPFDMKLPSFMQHLRLLEDAELVRSEKRGRVRTYELRPKQLRRVEDWLGAQRRLWERRLDQLDDYLLEMKENDS